MNYDTQFNRDCRLVAIMAALRMREDHLPMQAEYDIMLSEIRVLIFF